VWAAGEIYDRFVFDSADSFGPTKTPLVGEREPGILSPP